MKQSLLEFLICASCQARLDLTITETKDLEILSGELQCSSCQTRYPIRRGIPRFVDEFSEGQESTAKNFGDQWLAFDHIGAHHESQFLDWIQPVTPEFVRDKTVLEGGCGKGRHTRLVAGWGARTVIGVDLSAAVDAAFENTRDLSNVHIIQADIYRLPLRPAFDYAFSVGVLHHLPDPRRGFLSLASKLRLGGSISAWVYGRENNGWIVGLINPLRQHLTSKIPFRLLYYLSYIAATFLYVVLQLVYRPLRGAWAGERLFYAEYLNYISEFPLREVHNIVHDHLTAPIAHYINGEEFGEWFSQADKVQIAWHNRNSWRGFGRVGVNAEGRHGQ